MSTADVFEGDVVDHLVTTGSGADAATTPAERLAGRVRTVRTRVGSGELDRWLLVIGGVLLPLGVLLVVLGWMGASQTPLVFEQVPYLISGGLLGACLVFAGGFVYFAYWQTVQVRDGRLQHRQLLEALNRIEGLIAAGATTSGSLQPTPEPVGRLVTTAKGSMFHRVDCPVVVGRDGLRTVTGNEPGLMPCRICLPQGV